MKKAGIRRDTAIMLATADGGGLVILNAGTARILTLVTPVLGFCEPVACAVLVDNYAVL
jgi:hypothetical protein